MAHQSKFVSVNLNKSYGQPTSSSSVHGRLRSGSAGGGGSGGMVVLSRARSSVSSSAKASQKLAIPPPLNLPSLRKEHERFDPASAGSGAGHGSLGVGSRTGSPVLGWSKPAIPPASPSVPEKDDSIRGKSHLGRSSIAGNELGGSPYMPPGARPGGQLLNIASASAQGFLDKAVILKGEDFPSLRATFSSAPKQREALKQKQMQRQGTEEQSNGREVPVLHAPLQMRPQIRSSRLITDNVSDVDGESIQPLGYPNNLQKQDGRLPALLPQVLLHHTLDWTDDERDTGLYIPERDRDRGFSRSESVQMHDAYHDRLLQDTGTSSPWSRDFLKSSSMGRDLHNATNETHEFGSSRFSTNPRDRPNVNAFGANKDRHNVRPSSGNREVNVDGINAHSFYGENFGDGFSKRGQDYRYHRTELGSLESLRIDNKVVSESFSGNSAAAKNVHNHHNGYPSSWSKGTSFQNNTLLKGQSLTNNKATSLSNPILNFGRENPSSSSGVKQFLEDSEFDSKDSFSGSMRDMNAKVLKKKVLERQIDLHDPVRESFEAEVEKILRLREEEHQRILEEKTRALELARKEEEEKERLAREEEERRRLLEEEARELALQEEQEKLEVFRRAEEQRIAREEEKRRYQMEEERRKEGARKKLLELEARISRRQIENKGKDNRVSTFSNEQIPDVVRERDIPLVADDGGWEDGERLVERITGSSDSSSVDGFLEVGSRSQFPRDSFPSVVDRGKYPYVDSVIPSPDEENAFSDQRQDVFGYKRKEFHGGNEPIPGRPSSKEVMMESSQMPDEYHEQRKPRWSSNKRLEYFKRNNDADAEFNDDLKFGDVRMAQGNSHKSSHSQYNELSSDYLVDDFSSFTRSCQLPRQPHVPPPPYVAPLHRNSFRDNKGRASPSNFIDNDKHYSHASRYDHQVILNGNDNLFKESLQQTPQATSFEGNSINLEQESEKMSTRCASQLSLSVLSPPSSPALLSHHEMDVSRDSPPLPASADGDHTIVSDSEHIVFPLEGGSMDRMTTSSSVTPEVDDEWPVATNEETLENECHEFRDIAEALEGDNTNLHQVQDMEDLQSDTQTCNMEQVILGFNEGVEIQLPNIDSFEISSSNSEKEFKLHAVPAGCLEELIISGEISARKGTADSYSTNISEMEQAMHSLSLDPAGASDYSASSFEASQSSRLLDQPMAPATSLSMAYSATDPPSLSFPSIVSQVEAPVSLQFDLFSGPSLIPSPIQAIQIGSIQMPIHAYTHTSPSLPQVSSHSPLFQFGQLRYAPILYESTLPPVPHGTSISKPPVPAPYSFNQNPAGCLSYQAAQNISEMTKPQDEKPSSSSVNQISLVQKIVEPSAGNLPAGQVKPFVETGKNAYVPSQKWTNTSTLGDKRVTNESVCHAESHVHDDTNEKRSYRFNGRRKEFQPRQHGEFHPSRYIPGLKALSGTLAGGPRKRYAHSVRTSAPAPSFPNMDELQGDLSGFPRRSKRHICRTEFRVRDNIQGKKTQSTDSSSNMGLDENSVATGITIRNSGKKDEALTKSTRLSYQPNDSSSGASTSRVMSSDRNADKVASNESISKSTKFGKSHTGKGSTNASDTLADDGDVPLLNGVVRVFKQTGIEVPSNEDDFIEVRSKRQMLNDRREQRAKENKSKARVQKAPAKESTALQRSASKSNSNKSVASSLGDTANSVCSNPLTAGVKGSTKLEASFTFTANFSSQALPPIGTPSVNIGSEKRLNKLKSNPVVPAPAVSDSEAMPMFGSSENKNVNHGYSALPLSSWDNENLAIDLTQTQLDEAMKPSHFDSIVASSNVLEPPKLASSGVTLENSYSSCAASVNSLIAAEKIQFGAVILPNVLPSVRQTISKGLGSPDSSKSDLSKDQNLANSNHAMFLVKEKCSSQPSASLEDAEAEAEAAASAIAVAAITNDEIVGPVICSYSDTKTYSSADGSGLAARGVAASQEITVQSSSEESLTVALPADLSVDTPLSVWSALQSPQASMPMLSQFSGAPLSHFPSFEMNQIVDGCLFSYRSNDDSVSSQSQSQNGSLASSTLGAWPQYHSGVDSFYHPPAGYNGTFISSGGMPGVQCPPPMVVYNQFPPVGQYGQIGLGYMGTAYIPAGKQPEWSQKQVFSNARDNDGDPSNRKTVSGQGTATTAPSTVHNLGPGSSLMVASPLTMFDMNPFQSTANIPLQAWSPVPPQLHSVPLSIPLQQHLPSLPLPENRIPLQFGRTGDTSMGNNKSDVPHASASAEVSKNISITNSAGPTVSLGLVSAKQPTSSTINELARPLESTVNVNEKKVASTIMAAVVNHGGRISSSSSRPSGQITDAHSKTRPLSMPGSNHQLLAAGYGDQQHGNVNRAGSGGEWHRRFQVKKQGTSADKNIVPKIKQIYVAKPSSSGTSNQCQMKT